MQRYFIECPHVKVGEEVSLSASDSHHLIRVMRAKKAASVIVVTLNQRAYLAHYCHESEDRLAVVKIIEEQTDNSELPIEVTIACGLSKNDKIETIVQKATECGMAHFIPLALQRDVVKWDNKKAQQRIERLQKIAKEAAEQSHRIVVPQINAQQTLAQLLQNREHYDVCLVAYEETAKEGKHAQFKQILEQIQPQQRMLMVFGSEGGLSQSEINQLCDKNFMTCSLGPRILRAETAPIYALSAISYALEL